MFGIIFPQYFTEGEICRIGKLSRGALFPALIGNRRQAPDGKRQLYRKLLAKFAASYGDTAGRIRDALNAGDRQTAHNELHTLKGVTANLSLAPLADLVLAAEQAVKHDDTEHENDVSTP